MAPLITLTAAAQGFPAGPSGVPAARLALGAGGSLAVGTDDRRAAVGASATVALWWGGRHADFDGFRVGLLKKSPAPPRAIFLRCSPGSFFSSSPDVWSVLGASQVQLALLVAVSIDLLLARVVLSDADAGVWRSARSRRRPHSGCRRRSGPWSIRVWPHRNGGRSRCALPSGWCRGSAG